MIMRLGEYKDEIDELEPGQTIRVNHTTCPAGEDTRRRLYITRPQANPRRVIAYCHNCQTGSGMNTTKYQSYRDNKHTGSVPLCAEIEVSDNIEEPEGLVTNASDWTTEGRIWYIKSGLSQTQIDRHGIGQDPNTNRIYLPRYHTHNGTVGSSLIGYQLRKVEDNKGPKYLTAQLPDSSGYSLLYDSVASGKQIGVIVEDLVSGIHVQSAMSTAVVGVNYGVKTNLALLDSMRYLPKVIVWLDNDSNHIREQAESMARTLRLLDTNLQVGVVKTRDDPKHHSYDVIREVLDGFN